MTHTAPHRPSVQHKKVSLFVTCIVDQIYPYTGLSTVEILERIGVSVDFPAAQTCCGQMGFNAGYQAEAKAVAKQFLTAFQDSEVIVTPSGSCAAMVRHYYPQLFEGDRHWYERAMWASAITWELSEYLVDGLGVTDLGTVLDRPADKPLRAAIHNACHGFRGLGLSHQPRALLNAVKGLELVELPGNDQCCGFGGLFAIKMPEVSGAMLKEKTEAIEGISADVIVTGDASCLTQINGGLSRQGSVKLKRTVHLADVLVGRISHEE